MGERDIITLLARLFKKYGVLYILTGSFACAIWGRPRATHDIDFVIEVGNSEKLLDVLRDLDESFQVNLYSANEAIKQTGLFNVIHPETGIKIDFWIAKNNDFEKNKFKRKVSVPLFGERVAIVTAEDLILTKLSWCKEVFSERHMRDCIGILEVQKGKLNEKYLNENAKKLGVTELLKQACSEKYY